ncbi:MAG: hypothetical protein ACKO34_02510, partial [Vampirovibrionales bacterium]
MLTPNSLNNFGLPNQPLPRKEEQPSKPYVSTPDWQSTTPMGPDTFVPSLPVPLEVAPVVKQGSSWLLPLGALLTAGTTAIAAPKLAPKFFDEHVPFLVKISDGITQPLAKWFKNEGTTAGEGVAKQTDELTEKATQVSSGGGGGSYNCHPSEPPKVSSPPPKTSALEPTSTASTASTASGSSTVGETSGTSAVSPTSALEPTSPPPKTSALEPTSPTSTASPTSTTSGSSTVGETSGTSAVSSTRTPDLPDISSTPTSNSGKTMTVAQVNEYLATERTKPSSSSFASTVNLPDVSGNSSTRPPSISTRTPSELPGPLLPPVAKPSAYTPPSNAHLTYLDDDWNSAYHPSEWDTWGEKTGENTSRMMGANQLRDYLKEASQKPANSASSIDLPNFTSTTSPPPPT